MKLFAVNGIKKEEYIETIKDSADWIKDNAEMIMQGFGNHLRKVEIKVTIEHGCVVVGDVECEYYVGKGEEEENEIA